MELGKIASYINLSYSPKLVPKLPLHANGTQQFSVQNLIIRTQVLLIYTYQMYYNVIKFILYQSIVSHSYQTFSVLILFVAQHSCCTCSVTYICTIFSECSWVNITSQLLIWWIKWRHEEKRYWFDGCCSSEGCH